MANNPTATNEVEVIDTGEKRDALGRLRTPLERRAELLAAYRQSGLTQTAFARREGIRYSPFCTWAQTERQAGRLPVAQAGRKGRRRGPAAPAMRFVEACLPGPGQLPAGPAPGLEVRLADGTVLRGGTGGAGAGAAEPTAMLAFPAAIKIYVAVEPVDMRKQFNGLWTAA